jgi:hypothetical protein
LIDANSRKDQDNLLQEKSVLSLFLVLYPAICTWDIIQDKIRNKSHSIIFCLSQHPPTDELKKYQAECSSAVAFGGSV